MGNGGPWLPAVYRSSSEMAIALTAGNDGPGRRRELCRVRLSFGGHLGFIASERMGESRDGGGIWGDFD